MSSEGNWGVDTPFYTGVPSALKREVYIVCTQKAIILGGGTSEFCLSHWSKLTIIGQNLKRDN